MLNYDLLIYLLTQRLLLLINHELKAALTVMVIIKRIGDI